MTIATRTIDPYDTDTIDSDYVAFDDMDRETLGLIAQAALDFIQKPPRRQDYDAWYGSVMALNPIHLGVEPENGAPPFTHDPRRTFNTLN